MRPALATYPRSPFEASWLAYQPPLSNTCQVPSKLPGWRQALTDSGLDESKVSTAATASGFTIPPAWRPTTLAVLHWGVLRLYLYSGIQRGWTGGGGGGSGRQGKAGCRENSRKERPPASKSEEEGVSVGTITQQMRAGPLGQGLCLDQLLYLAAGSRTERFAPGEDLFVADEPPSCVAVILQGLVLVTTHGGAVLAKLSPGDR